MSDPTQRFSTRVDNYVKYRPDYPDAVAAIFKNIFNLKSGAPVADIASGTGIFSRHLLKLGYRVIGVEPNKEMRETSNEQLENFSLFQSWDGRAEDTGLPDRTVEAITVAQAIHWFNLKEAADEFRRILKPGGWVLVVWNDRRVESSAFQTKYENLLLEFGTDYSEINHKGPKRSELEKFFGHHQLENLVFENEQVCTWEQLQGRLLSCSYIPEPDSEEYPAMMAQLREIFDTHNRDGRVTFTYDTRVYYGRLI